MKSLKYAALLAAAIFAGAIGSLVAQPFTMGLVAGPVGVGYPVLRTVPGTAAAPSESTIADVTSGEFAPAAAMWSVSVGGAEVERNLGTTTGQVHSVGSLTTAGSGTLTAALMTGGLVNRTGPTGAFTDTTDTAANIDAVLSGNGAAAVPVGMGFDFEYADGVAFAATLAGGTGVTIAGSTGVVASGSRLVRCVKTALTPTYTCG